MRIPEKYCCDICGKEISRSKEHSNIGITINVLTNCDWTEGRSCSSAPYITTIQADLCKDCLLNSTNIVAGYQGSSLTFIHKKGRSFTNATTES